MEPSTKRRKAAAKAVPGESAGSLTSLFHRQRADPQQAQENKENSSAEVGNAAKKARNAGETHKKTVEEIYQKKSQLEHILLRPDSYVGSTERQSQEHFVLDEQAGRMVRRKLEYVPALYKIFDEILVNAADNLVRCPTQDTIRVEVNRARGSITVWNNGQGLPVHVHKEHKVYVPEMVFGQLLTSDNYDDRERKVTGGRNGYGAKLTNIFSVRFVIETSDTRSGKSYKQVWEKNMTLRSAPQMKNSLSEDFTQVTFFPDLARFGMTELEDDIVALMRRRAYDVAATTHGRCKVFLDGRRLDVHSFQDYIDLYLAPDSFRQVEVVNDRWEVAVGFTDGSGFQQVSFVNSIYTSRGGGHVNYVADQVGNAILEKVSKQKGGLAVKAAHVKGYLWVFVNCLIENAAFDSQTKETLTSKRERFGSTCVLPESFITGVLESGIVEVLQEWSKALGKSELAQHLNRSDLGLQKRLFGVPKLEDANKAGTREGSECTLILTEGDSAKALAVAGLGVIGRDYYGVFPLRGKLRNVRELSVKQMLENKEIDQVMKIMALDASKEYLDGKGMRYGSIMIMTDQDHDGSHIKGLIINFIQHWFPSLLKVPGFLKEFVTPIVKVTKGDECQTFFTLPEYSSWKEDNDEGRGWKCKYYKGLGTSTSAEARDYFSDLQTHEIQFSYSGPEEDDLIDMAFHPKRADDRKQWIAACEEGTFVDHSEATLSYHDFVKKELVLFAKYDVERAIPSVVDGFKPGQRKVLFGAFKRKLTTDMKVAQLAGYVAEHSSYHHGESSLQGTIVGLAQNFVGSNNVNLFIPSGQFGTRLQGGKDHAAARYIFTRLSRTARRIFPEQDDAVLEYLNDEGLSIEPRWYCPVIPLVLVNGADGIGTGWSTSVPNYNPREIIANIRRCLKKEPMEPMMPWYRGFKGVVSAVPNVMGRYDVLGVATKRGRVCLEISELPVKKWTQDYKEFLLEQLPQGGSEKRSLVTEIREYHTENSVHFVLSMTPDKLAESERKGFEKVFHLRSTASTTNMWLFDASGSIQKYETPQQIIEEFVPVRLSVYGKRKNHLIEKAERELAAISNKTKFIRLVVSGRLDVEKRKSADVIKDMRRHGLQSMRDINDPTGPALSPEEEAGSRGYKYLLSMKLWSLTEDKINTLEAEKKKKEEALEELRKISLEALWERDLVLLEEALDACDEEDRKEAEAAAKLAAKHRGNEESFLSNKQCVLVLSRNFRAKRVRTSGWKARRRGARLAGVSALDKKGAKKGAKGAEKDVNDGDVDGDGEEEEVEPDDALAGVFACRDFDALLVFSEHGMVYMLQALDIPLAKKMTAQGSELKDFLPELGEHRIAALVTVSQKALRDQCDEFVVLVTANGMAKKASLDRFRGLRPGKGLVAMKLSEGDELRWAHRATLNSALVLVTAQGCVLRSSLGQDWPCSTAKGAGYLAMRMRSNSDDFITSCGISELTEQEIAAIAAAAAKRREKKEAKALGASQEGGPENSGKAAGDAEVAAVVAAAADDSGVPVAPRPKSAVKVDDDDSDDGANGADKEPKDNNGKPAAASGAGKAEGADGEDSDKGGEALPGGKDSDSEKDQDQGDSDGERLSSGVPGSAEPAGPGVEPVSSKTPRAVAGQCLLLVTECGMGLRMPISCRWIGLRRRGQRGKLAIKVAQGRVEDSVVAACIVSGKVEAEVSFDKGRKPFQIFFDEQRACLAQAPESQASAAQPQESDAPQGATAGAFGAVWAMQAKFNALPQAEQDEYIRRSEEEKQRIAALMEERRRQDVEEVLVGSEKGLMVRVAVGSIPIALRARKGSLLCRLKDGDFVCAAALLSSMDDDPEEDAVPSAASSKPALPRRPAAKRAAAGTTTPAGQARVLQMAPAEQGAQALAEGRVTGHNSNDGAEADDFCVRRLRGKTQGSSAALCPWLGKRGRISLLAASPRSKAAAAGKYAAQQSARLSIVKPQLRLINKTRKSVVVRSLDLSQWAAKAAAAASAASSSGDVDMGR